MISDPGGVFCAVAHTCRTNSSLPGTAEFKAKRAHGSEKWADAAVIAAGEEALLATMPVGSPPSPPRALMAALKTEEREEKVR